MFSFTLGSPAIITTVSGHFQDSLKRYFMFTNLHNSQIQKIGHLLVKSYLAMPVLNVLSVCKCCTCLQHFSKWSNFLLSWLLIAPIWQPRSRTSNLKHGIYISISMVLSVLSCSTTSGPAALLCCMRVNRSSVRHTQNTQQIFTLTLNSNMICWLIFHKFVPSGGRSTLLLKYHFTEVKVEIKQCVEILCY